MSIAAFIRGLFERTAEPQQLYRFEKQLSRFEQHCAYEVEGAGAFLSGTAREDCPYDRDTNNTAWNFWIFGYDNARHEQQTLDRGTITFVAVGPAPDYEEGASFTYTTEEAFRTGQWKPRYVRVPPAWRQ